MSEFIRPRWDVSRVSSDTLPLLDDEERRCLDLSVLQCSVLRQMVFPWAKLATRLVEEHPGYWVIVEQPQAYIDALEELELLLGGGYDGPKEGCPVSEVYVDRGDLPGSDFTLATLQPDNNWHELDLTNVVGDVEATRVLMRVVIAASVAGQYIMFREAGNTSNFNVFAPRCQVAGEYVDAEGDVIMSTSQHIEYLLTSSVTGVYLIVRGFWKPS